MKKIFAFLFCFAFAISALGCQGTKTHAVEGGVIGGVLGAGVGGIVGHQMHRGAEGAAIGAAAGIIGGSLIGAQMEKPGQQQTAAQPAANSNQMTQQQIVDLTKQGVHENVIIDKIRLTNSKFSLTADDVAYLKQQGVAQKVIDAMQGLT
ncbi:MAG: glycine zipper domain-containing protein [Candidatus Omnitrophota bacterium]